MKRITGFLLALTMIFSVFCSVRAENTAGSEEAQLLKGLGIYDSDQVSDTITRADFAEIIVRLLGVDESSLPEPQKQVFTDVGLDHPKVKVINYLFQRGVMLGHEDASFKPDNELTCREAAKILVSVLGYTEFSEVNGGYYTGYLLSAENAGILKGVNVGTSDKIDTGNLAIMIVNTMQAPVMTTDYKDGNINISTDKDIIMMEKYLNIGKYNGVVEGYSDTSLESSSTDYGKNNAKIGGVIFRVGEMDLSDWVGMSVTAYYRDNDGEYELVYLKDKKNTVAELSSNDIESATLSEVKYFRSEESSKTSTFKIASDAIFLYNGKRVLMVSKEDLTPAIGSVKLIDNDSDGYAEVVVIKEYKEYAVKTLIAKDETVVTKNNKGTLDLSEDKIRANFFTDGDVADFSAITSKSILNIAKSKDDTDAIWNIYITNEQVEGVVKSFINDEDKSVLLDDGNEYKFSGELVKYIEENKKYNPATDKYEYELEYPTVGNSYTFSLNKDGDVADFEIMSSGRKYAYVVKNWLDDEQENRYIKMFTSAGEMATYKMADKISFNGKKTESANISIDNYQIVVYDINDNEELTKLRTAEDRTSDAMSTVSGDEFAMHYKSTETIKDGAVVYSSMRFYKNFAENYPYYFVNNETICFQVPNDKTKDADYSLLRKLDTDISVKGPIRIYDVKEGGSIGAMSASKSGSAKYGTPQMIDRVTVGLNEDDEECTQLEFVSGQSVILKRDVTFSQPAKSDSKGSNNWTSRIDYSGLTTKDLKRGDVVQYVTVDGYVTDIMVLVSVANIGPVRIDGDNIAENGNMLCKVLSVNDKGSRALVYYVDRFGTERYQSIGIGGSVYKYDSSTGKAEYATSADVRAGDTILQNAFWWSVKAVFIFR